MAMFEYQVIELSDKKLRGKHPSETLQNAINAEASKGWRFMQIDDVGRRPQAATYGSSHGGEVVLTFERQTG